VSEATGHATIYNEVMHFRPLARLKDLEQRLDINIFLTYKGETLPVSSIIGVVTWDLERGNIVHVTVRAETNASSALEQVISFIEGGCGE